MNIKKIYKTFLESLKRDTNNELIESVMDGFNALYETGDVAGQYIEERNAYEIEIEPTSDNDKRTIAFIIESIPELKKQLEDNRAGFNSVAYLKLDAYVKNMRDYGNDIDINFNDIDIIINGDDDVTLADVTVQLQKDNPLVKWIIDRMKIDSDIMYEMQRLEHEKMNESKYDI